MNLGVRVFGFAVLALGVVGLVWHDFALVWQPVPANVPNRLLLAYLVAMTEVLSGLTMLWRRTEVSGAITLAILFALDVLLLHVPHIIAHPMVVASWSGTAEQAALMIGGFLAFLMTARVASGALYRAAWILFGLCCIAFGIAHFAYEQATADFVPKYMPLGQVFWARFTGAAHIAAGLAILSGVRARIAAEFLTLMFLVFQALVHAPLLIADPHSHMNWTMNAMNLALVGSAWIVADSLRARSI
jgi:uncharacterized membrane protein